MEKFIRYKNIYLKTAIALLSCLIVLLSCKTKQPVTATVNPDQIIKISLYSKGEGIDRKAEGIIQYIISKYQKKGFDFTYVVTHWGREGEKDYCIDAQKLKAEDYRQLLNEIQASLKDMQVHIYEKHPCGG